MFRATLSTLSAALLCGWTGAACAVELTQPPPAKLPGTVWVGFAISQSGRVFSEQSAEEERARIFAKHECERATSTTCHAIAVPKSWKVAAIRCESGGFVAGVPEGSALPLARHKAAAAGSQSGCRQVYAR